MGSLVLTGNTSGSVTVAVPDVAGSNTATIGAATGTHYPFTAGTAVASTSGTSIDFTGIPSWVKRITVMFNGVSASTSSYLVQIGSGSVTTSGYASSCSYVGAGTAGTTSTAGFLVANGPNAASIMSGQVVLTLFNSNAWVSTSVLGRTNEGYSQIGGGNSSALGGTLDRVRITTVNGTDTFDAGSINILYE